MTALLAPAVIVRSLPSPHGGVAVEFRARAARVPPVRVRLSQPAVLDDARRMLDVELAVLKERLPTLSESRPDVVPDFLAALRSLGRRLLFMLFGKRHTVQLTRFWHDAISTRPLGTAPLVECVGAEASMLPLEFLPLRRPNGPDLVHDRNELRVACEDFVGFSCLILRELADLRPPRALPLRRDAHGRLPVRYFHHDELADGERRWFQAHHALVDLEGPYPVDTEGTSPTVVAQICDPTLSLAGGRRTMPDQVLHFSCHCYAEPDVKPWDYEIHLKGGSNDLRLTLGEIGSESIRYAVEAIETERDAELPLVFMNACGSSTRMYMANATSFPRLFLDNGNRGFIGTEVTIPDDVATQFSCYLYERLLVEGEPLGSAMLGARLDLLTAYGNPLGLTYSAYADPEIRLETDLEARTPIRREDLVP